MGEAADLAKSYVNSMTSLDQVAGWDIDLAIADMALVPRTAAMPDLSEAVAALQRLHRELAIRRDPLVELHMTAATAADGSEAAKATALAPVVIAVAPQDVEDVERMLREVAPTRDAASLSPLRAWLEDQESRTVRDAELARPQGSAKDQKPQSPIEQMPEIEPGWERCTCNCPALGSPAWMTPKHGTHSSSGI